MAEPKIADTKPIGVELEVGKQYYWCACGRSGNQPFCDGSHKETEFSPKHFAPEKSGEAYLCMCKQTKNPPYCDGSHKQLKSK